MKVRFILVQKNFTYLLLERWFLVMNFLECGHVDVLQSLTPARERREFETAVAWAESAGQASHALAPSKLLSDGEKNFKAIAGMQIKKLVCFFILVWLGEQKNITPGHKLTHNDVRVTSKIEPNLSSCFVTLYCLLKRLVKALVMPVILKALVFWIDVCVPLKLDLRSFHLVTSFWRIKRKNAICGGELEISIRPLEFGHLPCEIKTAVCDLYAPFVVWKLQQKDSRHLSFYTQSDCTTFFVVTRGRCIKSQLTGFCQVLFWSIWWCVTE